MNMNTTEQLVSSLLQSVLGELDRKYRTDSYSTVTYIPFPEIKNVIFNGDTTIVYFTDNTKVLVKKSENDNYSKEIAIVYAIIKKIYGKYNPETGIVEGNGFMNRIYNAVANGYDQKATKTEKFVEEVKPAKPVKIAVKAKKKVQTTKTGRFAVKSRKRNSKGQFV